VLIVGITTVRNASADVAQTVLGAARAVTVVQVEVVISGVRAAVAHSLVDVAHTMKHIVTKATLKEGIANAM
jgi:rsbT co-antagonist protein RsbR